MALLEKLAYSWHTRSALGTIPPLDKLGAMARNGRLPEVISYIEETQIDLNVLEIQGKDLGVPDCLEEIRKAKYELKRVLDSIRTYQQE